MSKKKAETEESEGLSHLEGEPVEIVAKEPPAKQYRVIARGGFWDGRKLHPKGSVVTYSGPVKKDSDSLKPL
jgi:hypothetical protein